MVSVFSNTLTRAVSATLFIVFLSLILVLFSHPLVAQDISFTHLSIEDGLSFSRVLCLQQDKYGFMWIGTEDGLNMFDGYTFRVFRNDPEDPKSLANNMVYDVYEDRSGALWIGTSLAGLSLFNRQTGSFTRYPHTPEGSDSLTNNTVWTIYEDRSGKLWIGTSDGLKCFDRQSKSFIPYRILQDPKSVSSNAISEIYEDRKNALWIGTSAGLNLFNRETGSFTRFRHDPQNPWSISSDIITKIYEDRSGALWVGTAIGLNLFDRETGSFTRFQCDPTNPRTLSDNFIKCIHEDGSGALWIGTLGGLNLFDRETRSFVRFQHEPGNPNSLSDDHVMVIHEDRSGAVWIGTSGGGLNLFDRKRKPFTHYRSDPNNTHTLSNNAVGPIFEDSSGLLWIGTGGGLNLFDRPTKSFTHYWIDRQNPHSLSNNITSICEDSSHSLWIGTSDGPFLFHPKRRSFARLEYSSKTDSFASNWIVSINKDRSGKIWLGTAGGLYLFDRFRQSFTRYQDDPGYPNVRPDVVFVIHEDRTGALWFGGHRGLRLLDRQTHSFTRYQNDQNSPNSISTGTVGSIHEDRSGGLWVGTPSGLNLFDRTKKTFKRYTRNDGLPNDDIGGILEDDLGRLWIGTEGISRFNPRTGEFKNYDVSDGLGSNEIYSGCKTRDGMMYFGSINGITAFHPDSIRDNPYIPQLVITDLLLFNKPVQVGTDYNGFVLPQSVTTTDELVLSYRESVFTLEFSALCYVNPRKQKYAYRLEGFDKEWTSTDARRRFATYTNLDPGTYIFRVKGSNHDGIWNDEGRSLRIIITPPWWKTVWAYLGYGIAIISVLYSVRRSERKRDRQKQQAELDRVEAEKRLQQEFSTQLIETQEAERKRVASELHDSLGQHLLIVNNELQLYQQGKGENDPDIQRTTSIVKDAIKEVREIASNLHPHHLEKLGLRAAIEAMIEQVSRSTTVRFDAAIEDVDNALSMPAKINLYRTLQEAIANIVRHSGATQARITISLIDNAVQTTIQDNGKGFTPEASHGGRPANAVRAGFGLKSMAERMSLIGGTITFDSAPGKGTTIKIAIPIHT